MSVSRGADQFPGSGGAAGDLLGQAAAILSREAGRLPLTTFVRGSPATIAVPAGAPEAPAFPGASFIPAAGDPADGGQSPALNPTRGAIVPSGYFDVDRLRKQAHDLIETLLITFSYAASEKGLPTEDKVPLLQCEAPVQAGAEARAILTVGNEESTPSDVALYGTNFVSDSGYEIPALRVTTLPRRATIPAKGRVTFEIRLAVSQQTPAGIYSGLMQAMGSRYVKAVLSVEVL